MWTVAYINVGELKRRLPNTEQVARDMYRIELRGGQAKCPFPQNHKNGDRDPSLRYDRGKDRIFCASQQCFEGQRGVDAFGLVRTMDGISFPEAVKKVESRYGTPNGSGRGGKPKTRPTGKSSGRKPAEDVRRGLENEGYQFVREFHYLPDLRKIRFEHKT